LAFSIKPFNVPAANFVVPLPKVTIPEQVIILVKLFKLIEKENNLQEESLKMETMAEPALIIMNDEAGIH
jgi:malate synthase